MASSGLPKRRVLGELGVPRSTYYRCRGPRWAQKAPNHISKMVLSTVKIGPPNWTKSRTFTLRFALDL